MGCGGKGEPGRLVRLAADASGQVRVDADRRQGGRGAWLHPDPACLARALKRRAFGRALRREGLAADAGELERTLKGPGSTDRE